MAKGSLYKFRPLEQRQQDGSVLRIEVLKFDKDFEPEGFYTLAIQGKSITCSCPAGFKWCRHKQMYTAVQAFDGPEKPSANAFYDHDKNQWVESPYAGGTDGEESNPDTNSGP